MACFDNAVESLFISLTSHICSFFPGDKPTLCFFNITLVAICAFDFIHCALAMFGVNHVLVGRKQITNLLGGG